MTLNTEKWVTLHEADKDEVTGASINNKCKNNLRAAEEAGEFEKLEDIKNDLIF